MQKVVNLDSAASSGYFKPKQVAQLFNCSLCAVYRWIHTGEVVAIRLPGNQYRISADSVESIRRGEYGPKEPQVDITELKEREIRKAVALAKLREIERNKK